MNTDNDLNQRVGKLESEVGALKGEASARSSDLHRLGLMKGSRGVATAFIMVSGIFLVNAAFKCSTCGELLSQTNFLYLVGMIILGLVFYFAFIFSYSLYVNLRKQEIRSEHNKLN